MSLETTMLVSEQQDLIIPQVYMQHVHYYYATVNLLSVTWLIITFVTITWLLLTQVISCANLKCQVKCDHMISPPATHLCVDLGYVICKTPGLPDTCLSHTEQHLSTANTKLSHRIRFHCTVCDKAYGLENVECSACACWTHHVSTWQLTSFSCCWLWRVYFCRWCIGHI